MKRITAMLLAAVLMLSCSVTALAEEDGENGICVTLLAGDGTGEEILLDSSDEKTAAESWEKALPGMFLKEEKKLYLRIPALPEDYEAPEKAHFSGWILSAAGEDPAEDPEIVLPGFWLEPEAGMTLTARWSPDDEGEDRLREVKLSLEAPVCGTEIKAEKKGTVPGPAPEILIPAGAAYQAQAAWVKPPFLDEEDRFSGKMEGGGICYAEVLLTGADFSWDVKLNVSGGEVYACGLPENSDGTQTLRLLIAAETEHVSGEKKIENEKEATCSEDGSYEEAAYCTACGRELSRETVTVDRLPHTPGEKQIENEIEATCAREGSYEEAVYCTVCGEEISRISIKVEKPEHIPGEPVIENKRESGCAAEGGYDEVIYCTVCGEELSRKTERTPKTEHTPGDPAVENEKEATCAQEGSRDEVVRCTVCGEELSRQTIKTPKKDHVWGEPIYDWADDFSTVTAKRVCSNDPSHVETETVPTSGVEERATCLKGGVMTYAAVFKNPAFTQQTRQKVTTAATGHQWGNWQTVTAATTTSEGLEARVCVYDPTHVETRVVPRKTVTPSGGTGSSSAPQHVHTWNAPSFSWKADFSGATATFVCKGNKNHTQRAEASVKSETILPSGQTDGKKIYTATVIFEGKSFTDTKEVAIRAVGDEGYSSGTFSPVWTGGGSDAAEFRVSRRENGELTGQLFQSVSVDGKELSPDQYSFAADGTMKLQPAYLSTLDPGEHTVLIRFADGSTETGLTVQAQKNEDLQPAEDDGPEQVPPPDSGNDRNSSGGLFWWIAIPVTAGAALAAVLLVARKKRST